MLIHVSIGPLEVFAVPFTHRGYDISRRIKTLQKPCLRLTWRGSPKLRFGPDRLDTRETGQAKSLLKLAPEDLSRLPETQCKWRV